MHFSEHEVSSDPPHCESFLELESILANASFILISNRDIAFSNGTVHLSNLSELSDLRLEVPTDLSDAPVSPVNANPWVFLCSQNGVNYFAVSVQSKQYPDLEFKGIRSMFDQPPSFLGSLGAKGVCLLNWRRKNQFSSRTGGKLEVKCLGTRLKDDKYFIYPRINPVVITLIVSKCGNFCLLGRGHRHPKNMYSCLAGFAEIGETLEQACAREVMEESGIHLDDIRIWKSQPWPCSNRGYELMIGMIGTADKMEHIRVQKSELADVRWFSRDEIKMMINRQQMKQKGLWVPGRYAIAHHLIQHFASGNCNNLKSSSKTSTFGTLTLGVTIGVALGATLLKTYQRASL